MVLAKGKGIKLSLCMIVRDEAENLPRALNSVRALVDEMVIVDTGSQDGTPLLAQELGAQVYSFPWTGDFAAAKNYALEKAQGRWILFLDADEELAPASQGEIPALLRNSRAEGYLFSILSYRGTTVGPNYDEVPFLRLFRRRPHYRYQRAVHEQLTGFPYHSSALVKRLDIRILHYGYLDQEMARKRKSERNLHILLQRLGQDTPDQYDFYYLGLEYLRLGQVDSALAAFNLARQNLDPRLGWAKSLVKDLVLCLIRKGDLEAALTEVNRGLELYPDYTDLVFNQGILLGEKGLFQEAAAAFQRCLDLGPAPAAKYPTDAGVGGYRARFLLGQMEEKLGLLAQAAAIYEKAIEENPGFTPPLYRLAPILIRLKGPEAGREALEAFFELHLPAHRLLLADIWSMVGQYPWVLEHTADLEAWGPLEEQGTYLRGLAYFRLGNHQAALPLFQRVPPTSPYFKEAGLGLAYIYWNRDEKEKAQEVLGAMGADEKTYLTLADMFFQEAVAVAREGARRFPAAAEFQKLLHLAENR